MTPTETYALAAGLLALGMALAILAGLLARDRGPK